VISEIVDAVEFEKCLAMVEKGVEQRLHDLRDGNAAAGASAEEFGLSAADLKDTLDVIRDLRTNGMPGSNGRDAAWMPRNRMAAILQSAIEEFYRQAQAVEEPQGQGLAAGDVPITNRSLKAEWQPVDRQGFARAFESTDPRWAVSFLAAKAVSAARGQHTFPTVAPPAVKIANKSRVLLVGDWGSGIPRAQKVAGEMVKALTAASDRECHVIHLGDVYYSGFESEYKDRFLPFWPVKESEADKIGSYSLNANHDMFTGGHAYFDFLLQQPRFERQGGSSYFSLENDNWQILGLDTGYDPQDARGEHGTLFGPQSGWVRQRIDGAPTKKTVLMSHHQLFSAWESGSEELERKLGPVLPQVTAWFWAHEHRCAIYDQNHPVKHARLVGHGGIPVYAEKKDTPVGVAHEFRENFRSGLETFARFGFCILDFDGDAISAQYMSEQGGNPHFTETIR
jgi:hypothetical protein